MQVRRSAEIQCLQPLWSEGHRLLRNSINHINVINNNNKDRDSNNLLNVLHCYHYKNLLYIHGHNNNLVYIDSHSDHRDSYRNFNNHHKNHHSDHRDNYRNFNHINCFYQDVLVNFHIDNNIFHYQRVYKDNNNNIVYYLPNSHLSCQRWICCF
mmetsp:Transcript_33191/g.53452  ORF Transcript_33191/g.53452 Transcript_33191/m.53452 type:complete len:154 (+) Transcript_33191:113-574(+)